MPVGTRIHSCVLRVQNTGKSKPAAIRICQASTGQSYMTGKKSKGGYGKKKR